MIVVVDTNIVFSIIANTKSILAKVFFNVPSIAEYYAPDFLISELQLHREKLLKISKLSEVKYELAKTSVFAHINFVDVDSIADSFKKEALSFTKDIDFKDFQFVALTLFLGGILWTGDRKLYNGLRRKKFMNVVNTRELSLTLGL